MSSFCTSPRATTSPFSQILNYLTFGPTQVQEIVDTEFGGPLPIAHVMCYFNTQLHHLKETNTQGFTAAFAFIDLQPDLAYTIAAIEPDTRMYLLGVSTDSLSDWGNRTQKTAGAHREEGKKKGKNNDKKGGTPAWRGAERSRRRKRPKER